MPTKNNTPGFASLLCLVLLPGCVTVDPSGKTVEKSREDALRSFEDLGIELANSGQDDEVYGPPAPEEARTEIVAGTRIIRRKDGRITKFFSVVANRGEHYKNLIVQFAEVPATAIHVIPKGDVDVVHNVRNSPSPGAPVDVSDWIAVTGNEDDLERVDQFLEIYFASVPQIEIEVKIAEFTTDDTKDVGAVTSLFFNVPGKIVEDLDAAQAGTQDPPPNFKSFVSQVQGNFPKTATTAQGDFVIRKIIGDTEVKSTFSLLASLRNVDIISAPRITVRNGGRAEITNGEEIPFVNVNSFNPNQANFTGSITFKKTGVDLYIVPYLAGSETVFLDLEASVRAVTGFTDVGGAQNPIINNRTAKSSVHVRDGQTFIIGGLVSKSESEFVDKVPLLGDLPLIGALFRSSFNQQLYTEVVFFITPRVIFPESSPNTVIEAE